MQRGFLRTIILIVILIIIIGFLGFDLKSIIESPIVQKNLQYAWSGVVTFWENILREPTLYIWNNLFKNLLKEGFTSGIGNIGSLTNGGGLQLPSVPLQMAQ